jgi:hypothetical protein
MGQPDQPRGLVVRVSDYWSWGTGFDSRFCHGDFSLKRKIPMATMVWVIWPLLVLHIHISPSTSSGQRNCASWASHSQKSVTLRPQPGGETTKSIRDMWWHWKKTMGQPRPRVGLLRHKKRRKNSEISTGPNMDRLIHSHDTHEDYNIEKTRVLTRIRTRGLWLS